VSDRRDEGTSKLGEKPLLDGPGSAAGVWSTLVLVEDGLGSLELPPSEDLTAKPAVTTTKAAALAAAVATRVREAG
jgi:hypothetical protein